MNSAGFDSGGTLAERFRAHAGDDHSLYAFAMRGMGDDWEAGGVVRRICTGWEDAPQGSVVQLRLLAGVFRIVLRQEAPELAPYYESLGGTARPESVWPVMRAVMSSHVADLQEALTVAPQTNEVGRSAALLVGIFEAVRRSGLTKIRLLEPGASAGLNLLVDRFRFENPSWSFGPVDSPLVMRDGMEGVVTPQRFSVVSRRGCDLEPVDATTPDGQLRLISFVWPFHVHRHERLRAALTIAEANPVEVDRAGAGEWVERMLDQVSGQMPPAQDVLTVVWHSVTRMYWPAEETARVEAAVASAKSRMAVVHVAMEYPKDRPGGADRAELSVDGDVLAEVAHHGRTVLSADR
jgi:hypothetical protein